MSVLTRVRYVIAANINALLERAENPEKLLAALVREIEDARDEARPAITELLTQQRRQQRLELEYEEALSLWQDKAEQAVSRQEERLARSALQSRSDISRKIEDLHKRKAQTGDQIVRLEQAMQQLDVKLVEARTRLKSMRQSKHTAPIKLGGPTPADQRTHRALARFDRVQERIEHLEARVAAYEIGCAPDGNPPHEREMHNPVIELELASLKERIGQAKNQEATEPD